jgi:hypothetical protein
MRTGTVESNLLTLNELFRLPYIDDLVQQKLQGAEKSKMKFPDLSFHWLEYGRFVAQLETEGAASHLPEEPRCRRALNDLLIRLRLQSLD